jgi:hypothetical protein
MNQRKREREINLISFVSHCDDVQSSQNSSSENIQLQNLFLIPPQFRRRLESRRKIAK